jgi:hypothetical protein
MMAEYANERLGVSFTLPDAPTVRQQLAFRSEMFLSAGGRMYERMWEAAQSMLSDWECERMPNPRAVDLDEETDAKIADIIFFVGNTVAEHLADIGAVPKNG